MLNFGCNKWFKRHKWSEWRYLQALKLYKKTMAPISYIYIQARNCAVCNKEQLRYTKIKDIK